MGFLGLLLLTQVTIVVALDQFSYLEAHNNYRRNVQPHAANMKKLKWSEELALKAQRWASKCTYGPDPETSSFSYACVGENYYLGYGNPTASNVVLLWASQSYSYSYENDHCNSSSCDDYKQVVWADTEEIGCAEHKCQAGTLVVCNYGPGAKPSGQPYIKGFPCTLCPSGFSCQDGLCV
uniref:GLIPR1-like protein 1 n=1 Tax=Crassostrea virginica TaxID=6565 RepID=A0A8B8DQ01_CRAVI|nr:GLIPR1-like protein 1 [Crassostrea virginica]